MEVVLLVKPCIHIKNDRQKTATGLCSLEYRVDVLTTWVKFCYV